MSRFLRDSLRVDNTVFHNYAVRPPVAVDLSLVSGPFIWGEELSRARSRWENSIVHKYPLPNWDPELLATLADWEGVPVESLYLSSGADSAIEIILSRVLENGDTLGILSPNFPRFGIVAATLAGVSVTRFTNLTDFPVSAKVVACCTPNNPSTEELDRALLCQAIAAHPDVLFIVDGVFDWYGSYSLVEACSPYDNVIVLKSFSKIGLAGLRLGYAIGHPDVIQDLQLGTTPFAVPALVQIVGLEIAKSFARVQELKAIVENEFALVASALGGQVVRHSPVPFYLLHCALDSAKAAEQLAKLGVAVVDCDHCPDVPSGHVRISIGTREENSRFLAAIDRTGILG